MVLPLFWEAAVVTVVTFVVLGVLCAAVAAGELVLMRASRRLVERYRQQSDEYRRRATQADAFVTEMQQSYTAMSAERDASHASTVAQLRTLHADSLDAIEQRYQASVEAIHIRYAAALVRLQARQPPPKVLRLHGGQRP
jgi:uncharacterized membrane-anchored protein YhcB (DUF1043 family)